MTPGAVVILDLWAASPGFREISIREAAAKLQDLIPRYPHPGDQPVEICVNGYRWFDTEMEAVADAIYRAARRPHNLDSTLVGSDWDVDRNERGLWAIPGRCPTRGASKRECASVVNPVGYVEAGSAVSRPG